MYNNVYVIMYDYVCIITYNYVSLCAKARQSPTVAQEHTNRTQTLKVIKECVATNRLDAGQVFH